MKNGYLPFYHPCETKKYFRKLDTYPIGTLPYTNTYYCDEGYGLIKYKTDRFGLRNRDSQWNKINSQNNIFLVGDSFVQGACVPDEWTISNQISNLSNINTLNLGSSCNCPYEYIVLLNFLLKPIISNSENQIK